MDNLIFYILGMLIMWLILQKPLQITIHHKHENVISPENKVDIDALEQQMLKEDPKKDQLYKELDDALANIGDIMGGSDR